MTAHASKMYAAFQFSMQQAMNEPFLMQHSWCLPGVHVERCACHIWHPRHICWKHTIAKYLLAAEWHAACSTMMSKAAATAAAAWTKECFHRGFMIIPTSCQNFSWIGQVLTEIWPEQIWRSQACILGDCNACLCIAHACPYMRAHCLYDVHGTSWW